VNFGFTDVVCWSIGYVQISCLFQQATLVGIKAEVTYLNV